jgi:hypothetical protein
MFRISPVRVMSVRTLQRPDYLASSRLGMAGQRQISSSHFDFGLAHLIVRGAFLSFVNKLQKVSSESSGDSDKNSHIVRELPRVSYIHMSRF